MSQTDIKDSLTVKDRVTEERERLETQIRNAGNWFFWIIGLSTINAIIVALGGNWHFVIGLGMIEISANLPLYMAISNYIQIAFAFGFFGFCAVKRDVWAFVAGMVLYALDAVLLVAVQDWLSLAFHVLVLFFLSKGLRANLQYNKYYLVDTPSKIAIDKANRKTKGAVMAGIILAVASLVYFLIGAFGVGWMNLVHSFILLALTFGVYKQNRPSAVLLFCYWVANSIYNLVMMMSTQADAFSSIGFLAASLFWGFFFYLGILGTFARRKLVTTALQV